MRRIVRYAIQNEDSKAVLEKEKYIIELKSKIDDTRKKIDKLTSGE